MGMARPVHEYYALPWYTRVSGRYPASLDTSVKTYKGNLLPTKLEIDSKEAWTFL